MRYLLVLAALLSFSAHSETDVLGFSQTAQWARYTSWDNNARGGCSVERYAGTTSRMTQFWFDRCWGVTDGVTDRIIFNISSNECDETATQCWVDNITVALGHVNDFYPDVQEVILEPVVGGPFHDDCNGTRAAVNHPVVDQAIAQVVDIFPFVVSIGFSPEVVDCGQYRDSKGHLTRQGGLHVAAQMEGYHQ